MDWSPKSILFAFVLLRIGQYLVERILSGLNRHYYLNPEHQKEAMSTLGINREDMDKALSYAKDKYHFSGFSSWLNLSISLVFLVLGGFGWIEQVARSIAPIQNPVLVGIVFFGILALLVMLLSLPLAYYNTFVIEARHGFNRQTRKSFVFDLLKSLVIGAALGGAVLAVILSIMDKMGDRWWIWAWAAMSLFTLFTTWLYPTLLAPLFNKFSPLEDGELKEKIEELAKKLNFRTDGLFVMDASTRSSHGNAYFTGIFGKKRIVLFDTLIDGLKVKEIVAVLAHELGHFKLHHVRWMLIRSLLMTGLTFYLLSLCLPLKAFYVAFSLDGVSNYGALLVFGMWFGLLDFIVQPFSSYLSRRNEFAADQFALSYIDDSRELGSALLKLREKSHSMPVSHPVYSAFYHSHPPMLERLKAMSQGT